ncbi:MAG: hypothetical protein ACFFCW_14880 [Candidatus Hodarchaeota archaeon]
MPGLREKVNHIVLPFRCFVWILALIGLSAAGELPPLEEWSEQGEVLGAPPPGNWDSFGWGTSSSSLDAPTVDAVVKKDGVFYLYYTGSSGPRHTDGAAAYRQIGVATSSDGINFTRYSGNPIVTWKSSNHDINPEEEGAEYCKVALDGNGNFIMYWAACSAVGPTTVSADIHLSTSSDGFNFTDGGVVIAWDDVPGGGGDEVWPGGLLHAQGGTSSLSGTWHLWFNTDRYGNIVAGYKIGLATGNSPGSLTLQPNNPVLSRLDGCDRPFGGSPVLHQNGKVSVILSPEYRSGGPPLEARDTTINELDKYSGPYLFTTVGERLSTASILPDYEDKIWRWYYMHPETRNFHLRTAPLSSDTTPPGAPIGLRILK